MPRLSGAEASALAYLAEYPQADDRDEIVDRLGADARKVAESLIGNGGQDGDAETAADAIRQWVDKKGEP